LLPLRSRKLGQEGEAVSGLRGYMLNYVVSNNFQAVEASLTYYQTLFHITNIALLDQWFGCRGTNSEGSESSKCSVLRDQHGATPTGEPRKGALLAIEQFSVRWSNPPIKGSWWSRSVVCKKLIQTSKKPKKENRVEEIKERVEETISW
jgi:hypothetical protein